MDMDKYVGKRLDGRYELQEIVGVGGMAVVYKAYDSIEDRIVAVKILKEEYAKNDEFLRRFKNESKAIALLSHNNIVKVFDVSFGDMIQYIVMEYIDGIPLKEFIEKQGSLKWKDAVYFTIQILRALQHAHDKGIVHRDVKPQNIMLLEDGTIKVADFGIARFARSEHRTMTDKAIGSVHYISPEQARGEVADEKADIYSVGVMLYEMLTGTLPFEAESAVSVAIMQLQNDPKAPRELNPTIPLGLEQITLHAMQKDATRRYKTAAEMLRDLEEFRRDPEMTFEYAYYVDDDPTRFAPALDGGEAPEPQEEERKKPPIIPVLAGIASTFVVAMIILAIVLFNVFSNTGEELTVPNLIGQQYETISSLPELEGFKVDAIWESSSEYENGYIFDQDPLPGKKVKSSRTITVKVSQGPKEIVVPDVVNKPKTTAKAELEVLGFTVNVLEEQSDEITKDYVIRTSPAAGESAPQDMVIDMYVSAGGKITYTKVPDLRGLTEADAKKMIESNGLTVGTVESEDNAMEKGRVIRQNPAYEAQVETGTAVNIVVSTGVAPAVDYTYEFEVAFPEDLPQDIVAVMLYVDGENVKESAKIDTSSVSKKTFTLTSRKETITVSVRFKYGDSSTERKYADYTVDFKNQKQTLSTQYNDYRQS